MKEAIQYFGAVQGFISFSHLENLFLDKIKMSPPIHRIHIECFHTFSTAVSNTRGNVLTRLAWAELARPVNTIISLSGLRRRSLTATT